MSNDIVTRLRDGDPLCRDGHIYQLWANEAADEIERLRRTVQLMHIDFKTQVAGLNMRCRCKGKTE